MKRVISLVAMLLLAIGIANAETDIWSKVQSTGGLTEYTEVTSVGGMDWSEGALTTSPQDYAYPPTPRTTAVVQYSTVNSGELSLQTYVNQPNPWEMVKIEYQQGTGYTEIYKDMYVWTEDKKEVDGVLLYPTEAWAMTVFQTPVPFYDEENAHFLMDMPPARDDEFQVPGNIGVFNKVIVTTDEYIFEGKEGINIMPCPYDIPDFPEPPVIECVEPCGCE